MTAPKATRRKSPKAAPKVKPTDTSQSEELPEITEEEFDALLQTPDSEGFAPINEDGSINPVQIGKRGRKPNELVTIFTLDGVDYQVPEKPSPALLLKFMRQIRNPRIGPRAAVENLFISLLGEKALDALADSPEVTEDDISDIFKIIAKIAFSALRMVGGVEENPS